MLDFLTGVLTGTAAYGLVAGSALGLMTGCALGFGAGALGLGVVLGGRQGGYAVHNRRGADHLSLIVECHSPRQRDRALRGGLTSTVKVAGDVTVDLRIGPSNDEKVGDCRTVNAPPMYVME